MAYATKGTASQAKRSVKTKDSGEQEDRTSESAKSQQRSELPKVKHREKKSEFALDKTQQKALKAELDKLCHPSTDRTGITNWLKLNARKDGKLREFLGKYVEQYKDMERFKRRNS